MFNSPTRRSTRQRSGYKVSGQKTGSEAKIVRAGAYYITSPILVLSLEKIDAALTPEFEYGIGLGAIGGYIKCEKPFSFSYEVKVLDPLDKTVIVQKSETLSPQVGNWHKFGLQVEIDDPSPYEVVSLQGTIKLTQEQESSLGWVQFIGVNLDTVIGYDTQNVEQNFGKQAQTTFYQKIHLYYPEIFYWNHEQPFTINPELVEGVVERVSDGEQIVLKACNRCARFLPIDLLNEQQALGFSNHCTKRAPCIHRAFSRYLVENGENLEIDPVFEDKIRFVAGQFYIHTYFGFQLECRPCKKFRVNAPLNPVRNAAQRREDSLRRRAFETLVGHLLKTDWIFYKFRREGRPVEFDTYIWEKFGKRCFACGKPLPQITDMDLDHTLPLVYLWSLDETATCLCSTCNSQKHARFPFEFDRYKEPGKLETLAELTGIDKSLLLSQKKHINPIAVVRFQEEIEWFFDNFLAEEDYQKLRHGKKAADLIVASLQRILDECATGLHLVQEYERRTGKLPTTVTINPRYSDLISKELNIDGL